ncbi:gliding motility protein [Streptomyces sp. NPDC091371]|uniref:gliding motility protein n=1 Tax=Streptomyces sp. NPDC091371 TaxID=3155303 RepID=UPI00344A7C9F
MTEEVAAETPTAGSGAAEETETEAGAAAATAPAAEAVEIPKQQSAELAADSGADESART